MSSVANAEDRQVAQSTAPRSIPAAPNTAGWTKMTYDKVTKVVTPPTTSVRTSLPRART
jgi:hypothetical protein